MGEAGQALSCTLYLSGPPTLECDNSPVKGFESDKAVALLAYLALHDRPMARACLAGMFWGDLDGKRARGNLRRVLHNLGKLLPECLHVDRRSAQFRPGVACRVDILAFRELTQVNAPPDTLEDALQWFRGPLLEGLSLNDCPEFELWLITERERWQQQVVAVLEQLITYDTRRGDYACALRHVDHLLALTPWHETAHRQKILLLARTGRRSAALRQYNLCCQVLRQELGVAPLPETTALVERLRAAGDSARHRIHIPPQPMPFVGREAELAALGQRLANPDCRLLTLVGVGGVGKTRLALKAAQTYGITFLDGVAFVPLLGISEAAQLPNALADALQISVRGQADAKAQLLDYIRDKELLLVLDNFEHVMEGAKFLSTLLREAPAVTLLITSRARLNLRWEWVFRVQGLTHPSAPPFMPDSAEDLPLDYNAVQLFFHVARRTQPEDILRANLPHIAHLCQLVEGLPLAVELAAAATSQRTCADIARATAHSLDALTSTQLDRPSRHHSLRAVFDYSWGLLSPREQRIFRRLAVFQGGFSAEAARQVSDATVQELDALAGRSLVRQVAEGRYEMHEMVRHYAKEQLRRAGKVPTIKQRHLDYVVALTKGIHARLRSSEQAQCLAQIRVEQGNIRAALRWTQQEHHVEKGLHIATGLWQFWDFTGQVDEGRQWLETLLAISEGAENISLELRARALGGLGVMLWLRDPVAAEAYQREGLALLRTLDNSQHIAYAISNLAMIVRSRGDLEQALALFQESLAMFRELGELSNVGNMLSNIGVVATDMGNFSLARSVLEEAQGIYGEIEQPRGLANVVGNLGNLARHQGAYQQAQALYERALSVYRELDFPYLIALSLGNLGHVLALQGEPAHALPLYREALALFWELEAFTDVVETLGRVAAAWAGQERFDDAARLLGVTDALRAARQVALAPTEQAYATHCVEEVAAYLGAARFQDLHAAGQARPVAEVVAEILSLHSGS